MKNRQKNFRNTHTSTHTRQLAKERFFSRKYQFSRMDKKRRSWFNRSFYSYAFVRAIWCANGRSCATTKKKHTHTYTDSVSHGICWLDAQLCPSLIQTVLMVDSLDEWFGFLLYHNENNKKAANREPICNYHIKWLDHRN